QSFLRINRWWSHAGIPGRNRIAGDQSNQTLNMKTAYLLLFLTTFSLKVVGQDFPNLVDNRTVTTVTYWEPGDKHTYLVTKSKEKSGRDTKEPVKRATSYEISFEVMEVTETSNTVKMMYDNYTYDDS